MATDSPHGKHDAVIRGSGAVILGTLTSACSSYAAADVRDAFLAALDEQDDARRVAIARHLVGCANPLPSVICASLGIANGSTYGAGALAVLTRATLR